MSSRPKFSMTEVLIAVSVPVLLIVGSNWVKPDETRLVVLGVGILTLLVTIIAGLRLARPSR